MRINSDISAHARRPRVRKTPLHRLLRTGRRFRSNTDGNIVFLFAFMSTVLFLFAGGAVDYARWNAVRADMIESMDAASLAMAQHASVNPDLTDAELKDYGRKFFEANFNYEHNLEPGWNIEFALENDAVIATCITGKIDTYLLGVAGIDKLNIDKCVEITKRGTGRVELALVLDVTGSMDETIDGKKKIASLKDAVTVMLDVMYGDEETSENIKIGVVPFNAHVNAGGASSWSTSWEDTDAEAYYHGSRFFHVDGSGNIDLSTKVNHFTLYETTPGYDWAGCLEARPYPLDELDVPVGATLAATDITAALEVPTEYMSSLNPQAIRNFEAFDDAPTPVLSNSILTNSDNFRWVPVFLPDEPDCNNNPDCEDDDDYNSDDGYVVSGTTTYGTPWFGYYFDDPDGDDSHTSGTINEGSYSNRYFVNDNNYTNHTKGEQFNKYAKVVHYFRNVLDNVVSDPTFKEFVNGLSIETGLDSGESASHGRGKQEYILRTAYVGWWDSATDTYKGKYDTPNSAQSDRGPERQCPTPILPLTDTRATIETHVSGLAAQGTTDIAHGAAWGWRLLSPDAPFTEGIGPEDEDYEKWQKAIVIMTDGNNYVGSSSTHWDTTPGQYGFAIESRMGVGVDTRDEMRDELDNKLLRVCHRMKEDGYLIYTIMFGLDSSSTEAVFKACATKPTEPYFHDAVDGDDLEDAFGEIAADLVDLHISK